MLTTTRAPTAASLGRSSAIHASRPGPWSPTLLSIPAGVWWTRGAAFPGHGSTDRDLTTTAPSSDRGKYACSSSAWPAVPEAVITGLGSSTEPRRTERSTSPLVTARQARPTRPADRHHPAGMLIGSPLVVLLERPHRQRVADPGVPPAVTR